MTFLGVIGDTICAGTDFISSEERCYLDAIQRKRTHLLDLDTGIIDNSYGKVIFFELMTYGDYFGSESIQGSIEYYIALRKLKKDSTEECMLLAKWIKDWGRKSAMTILVNFDRFLPDDRQLAVEIFETVEGVNKWAALKIDDRYLKASKYWHSVGGVAFERNTKAKQATIAIEKVLVPNLGELSVDLGNGRILSTSQGRATFTSGKLASFIGTFYTEFDKSEISKVSMSGAIAIDQGYGRNLIVWQDGSDVGLIQVIRGQKVAAGRELFVLKTAGFERPLLGTAMGKLSLKDLTVLSQRGKFCVDEFARNAAYVDQSNLCRFTTRPDLRMLEKEIRSKNGEIGDIESALIIYAKNLPSAENLPVFEKYNNLIKSYK